MLLNWINYIDICLPKHKLLKKLNFEGKFREEFDDVFPSWSVDCFVSWQGEAVGC